MKLTKGNVAFIGLEANLIKVIDAWQPPPLPTELRYRDALLDYLRANVPNDCRIEKEYRHNGTTIDLFLRWNGLLLNGDVFLEVKRNLNKKTTLDRLVGQIEGLEPGKRSIVIVLVGETDRTLLDRLRAKYRAFEDAQWD